MPKNKGKRHIFLVKTIDKIGIKNKNAMTLWLVKLWIRLWKIYVSFHKNSKKISKKGPCNAICVAGSFCVLEKVGNLPKNKGKSRIFLVKTIDKIAIKNYNSGTMCLEMG